MGDAACKGKTLPRQLRAAGINLDELSYPLYFHEPNAASGSFRKIWAFDHDSIMLFKREFAQIEPGKTLPCGDDKFVMVANRDLCGKISDMMKSRQLVEDKHVKTEFELS